MKRLAAGGQLAGATLVATATSRMNLAIHHLLGAAAFARDVSVIEKEHANEAYGEFAEPILWRSSACVMSSVAGLEAFANEMFVDRSRHFPSLPAPVSDQLWELLEQKPLLEKFDMALLLREKSVLDRGAGPTQGASVLIKLRNALTHFKPEWDHEQREHAKLTRDLAGRFSPSPFLPDTGSLFPRRWASAAACEWSVTTSIEFLVAFEIAAGLPSRIEVFKPRLEFRTAS